MTNTSTPDALELASFIKQRIRDVPDFPKPGIVFRDITTLLQDGAALRRVIAALADEGRRLEVEAIVGMESRGFIFGCAAAVELGIAFIPARKPGKLPWKTVSETYELEYGTDSLEIHEDAVKPGQRVLIVDDLLATGGTAAATLHLLERQGAKVAGLAFVIELGFLNGRAKLGDHTIRSLVNYDAE